MYLIRLMADSTDSPRFFDGYAGVINLGVTVG